MNRKLKESKILQLFKLASEEDLMVSWRASHPPRYSEDEIGFRTWKEDVKKSLGLTEESDLHKILTGEISPEILSKASGWPDISSLIPNGEKIRKKWQKSSANKSLSGFISWLGGIGHRDGSTILNSIVPDGSDSVKLPSNYSQSREKSESKPIMTEFNSDTDFYKNILVGLGAPVTQNNLTYLYAWRQAEGGRAAFNPFNTTLPADGATNYNKVGVKNYTSAEQGVNATVKTLKNAKYESIVNYLKMDKSPMETAEALVASPWGTSALIKKVVSGYEAGHSPKPPPIGQSTERIA